jgi:dTDP-4-dehydrorhamnose 3,5-epimerase
MAEAGLPSDWAQDNSSFSRKNVVRGIHYQVTDPQGKLVRVTHGAVLDVVVDLRRSSPSFGEHLVMELTAESAQMLWIPKGFGHAYLCLTEAAGFAYKVTASYSRAGERTILWNDPDLAIPWPIAPECAIVSEKDRNGTRFKDAEMFS